jgi:phosphoribosylamine-glycine ligase
MRCAFYEKEVTPPLGGDIPGYYVHRLTEDVVDRLMTRAVVFAPDADDPAKTMAVLTLDAVNCHRALGDAIKAAYGLVDNIHFDNAYYRHDIGARAMQAAGEEK